MMMTGFGGHIWMIIFWIAVLGGGIWLLAAIFPQPNSASNNDGEPDEDPLGILKQRYARGELSKEAFELIRHELKQA